MDNSEPQPMFHIGRAPSNTLVKKRKKMLKVKKVNKAVLQARNVKVKRSARLTIPVFKPYEGFRWKLPLGLNLTWRERHKFGLLETCSPEDFSKVYHDLMVAYSFENRATVIHYFPLCPVSIKFLNSIRDRERAEWLKVKRIYYKLFRFAKVARVAMRRRIRKICLRNSVNTDDIATMEAPKMPVYVLNLERKKSYVYEASTLRKAINQRLLMSEYMFAEPRDPINILSNEPFTYSQCISIYYQLKSYGMCSWVFELFKKYNFNMAKFQTYCSQQLKISAIDNHFKNEDFGCFETVYDFFTVIADGMALEEPYIREFKQAYLKNYTDLPPYIQSWKDITYRKYMAQIVNDDVTVDKIMVECIDLLKKIYDEY